MGKEFRLRSTGGIYFYQDLITMAGEIAKEINMEDIVDDVIHVLSKKLRIDSNIFLHSHITPSPSSP